MGIDNAAVQRENPAVCWPVCNANDGAGKAGLSRGPKPYRNTPRKPFTIVGAWPIAAAGARRRCGCNYSPDGRLAGHLADSPGFPRVLFRGEVMQRIAKLQAGDLFL